MGISYSNLKTENNLNEVNTFKWNGVDVNVLKYLPVSEKDDLIQSVLTNAKTGNTYDQLRLDVYFELYLVYLYTDIEFSEEDKDDEFALYDELSSSGLLKEVIENIENSEYEYLLKVIVETVELNLKYKNSAAGIISEFIQDLPANAAAAAEIVNGFDPDKFQAVKDFATAANGGRDISNVFPIVNN